MRELLHSNMRMVFICEDLRHLKIQLNAQIFDSANDLQDERALGLDFLMIDYMKVRTEPSDLLFVAPMVTNYVVCSND
jgi:hypothetical protein